MLGAGGVIPHADVRRYLLEKTQHMVAGGFGKFPGDPPDIYHSYLALASLSMLEIGKGDEERVVTGSTNRTGEHIQVSQQATPVVKDGVDNSTVLGPNQNEQALEPLDPALCFSTRAKNWIEQLSWRRNQQ